MKLVNYEARELIYQNLRYTTPVPPETFTLRQYQILCRLIRRKRISKQSFDILLSELYGLSNWKQLNYTQMYELIFILTNWDSQKVKL